MHATAKLSVPRLFLERTEKRIRRNITKSLGSEEEAARSTNEGYIDPTTQFVRNVARRMAIDSMTKISPTSCVLGMTPRSIILRFVGQPFVTRNEYSRKMMDITNHAEDCEGRSILVGGSPPGEKYSL